MIETFVDLIPPELRQTSGSVFYGGRSAFSGPASVYILGRNPGGDPVARPDETVARHTDFVLSTAPEDWSAKGDEAWTGRPVGEAQLQLGVQHLLAALSLDPRRVPASNLFFARSRQSADFGAAEQNALIDLCWPFHEAVIQRLAPRAIICLGVDTGECVRQRLHAHELVATFAEQNKRGWTSRAWRNEQGLLVFALTHPGRVAWYRTATDPSPMVARALREAADRGGEGNGNRGPACRP